MNIKKQLVLMSMSLLLGLALIGGGTYAFFSDSEETTNTFAAGTLDLTANPSTIIDVENLKPGDSIEEDFELENGGTLDIGKVTLDTKYTVDDVNNDNTKDLGEYIQVDFLYNVDGMKEVVFETTLADLKEMSPEAVGEKAELPGIGEDTLPAGEIHDFTVEISFLDNGEDQNQFQGDSLELEWRFNAEQEKGK